MKIVVGLGNPGDKYKDTKHNVGFKVVELLAARNNIKLGKKGFNGVYGVGRIQGEEVMLFMPMTYMNLSGDAVKAVVSTHLEEREDLLVVLDDFSIPLGTLRIRESGSSGGHNGLQSIIDNFDPEVARLRIGIGKEMLPEDKAAYVLAGFNKEDRPLLDEAIEKAGVSVEIWATKGIKAAGAYIVGCRA